MVYTTTVDDQTLHLAVSGMLWRRSLIMVDSETGTLWSHLLGKAMKGKLKGRRLESIPSTMTSWRAWKKEYPATTVINLPRTANHFANSFYRRPQSFVLGWVHEGEQAFAVGLDTMLRHNLLNLTTGDAHVVVTYDPKSTAASLFSRELNGRVLTFEAQSPTRMQDDESGSLWNSQTGIALQGTFKGSRLKPLVGIMSFRRAWLAFHPDSQVMGPVPKDSRQNVEDRE